MEGLLHEELDLVLIVDVVNDVANLSRLKELVIRLDEEVQELEAEFGVEVEDKLHFEGLGN